jgi:hypothetical protein
LNILLTLNVIFNAVPQLGFFEVSKLKFPLNDGFGLAEELILLKPGEAGSLVPKFAADL